MILGFKNQFVRPIIMGEKIHTIRVDKNKRWKPGRIIHFSTNVRTPGQFQFKVGQCTSVEEIEILRLGTAGIITITRDNKITRHAFSINKPTGLFDLLCYNDGLSPEEFIEWFVPSKDDYFSGRIIHWTDSSYT